MDCQLSTTRLLSPVMESRATMPLVQRPRLRRVTSTNLWIGAARGGEMVACATITGVPLEPLKLFT